MSQTVTATMSRTTTGARHELQAMLQVWRRELIRSVRQRTRMVTSLVQPLLFLFVLGGGLTPLIGEAGGLDFTEFVFPGVVAMSVLTTAIFGAVSIVWDREFGFLREMLVAPVSRWSLVLGKTLGAATTATAQGVIVLLLAPLVGVAVTPLMIVAAVGASLLMAIALSATATAIAAYIDKMETFQMISSFLLLPMLFLSGALFPLEGLPGWLTVLTRLNPLTYAIDPLRRAVFAAQDLGPAALEQYGAGVTLFGTVVPVWLEIALLGLMTVAFLGLAVRGFSRTD